MKRNLMLMGGKTYVISLPAGWIKKHGLKKGQEVNVEDGINKVIISADGLKQDIKTLTMEYSLDCSEKIAKAYQLGYDEVKVTGCREFHKAEEALGNLPGFEIISTKNGLCSIRCMSEIRQKDIGMLLRRAMLLISGKDKASVLRLINMCKRSVSKNGYNDYSRSLILYSLLSDMERAVKGIIKGNIMQDIPLRFTEIGFEELGEIKHPIAYSMQEMVLAQT